MPEVGNMTLPKKILAKGVTDMVRISDGRMSGTAFGTVILHVSPESAIGGNLGLVENGDMIKIGRRGPVDTFRSIRRRAGRPPKQMGSTPRRHQTAGM
jgi:dihydroxyacid dehydratase/phosphogluconate dehydratase